MRLASLVAAVAFASASLAAYADTTITFSGLPSSGFPLFTTYTESGFTVTNTAGQFAVGDAFGDPVPDLFMYDTSSSITVTHNGGGAFSFTDVDFANFNGTAGLYDIVGSLSGVQVFDNSGTIAGQGVFSPYGEGFSSDAIDSLVITLTNTAAESDLDNITLGTTASATPEPSSIALLGTGLLGVAGVLRKRLA